MSKNWPISESETDAPPSIGSIRRVRRPCFELLCTNIFSETANNGCSRLTVVDKTTWNRRISLGFPAFFKQFWLHLRKNFRKNLNKSFIINNRRRRRKKSNLLSKKKCMNCMSTNLSSHFIVERKMIAWLLFFFLFFLFHLAHNSWLITFCLTIKIYWWIENKRKSLTGRKIDCTERRNERISNQSLHSICFIRFVDWK